MKLDRPLSAVFPNISLPLIVVFLILNACKSALLYYIIFNHEPFILYSHFIVLFAIACTVFLSTLRSSKPYFFFTAYIIQLLYLLVNGFYFFYFSDFMHLNYFYSLLSEYSQIFKHFSASADKRLLILFLDLPLLVLIMHNYSHIPSSILKKSRYLRVTVASAIGVLAIFYGLRPAVVDGPIHHYDDYDIVKDYGFVAHNIADLIKLAKDQAVLNSISYGKQVALPSAGHNQANILMIQVESLDANIINATYRGRYITPFLHALSKKSIYYPYVLSYRKAGGTSDCEIAVLNSFEPLKDFPTMKLQSYTYPNSIVKKLKERNYRALAFHGNTGDFWNRNKAYEQMRFDRFYDRLRMGLKNHGWGAMDKDVFGYVAEMLRSGNEPFFYYVITMSSHEPFRSVASYYDTTLFDDIEPELTRNYFTSIRYVDDALRDFIRSFRKKIKNAFIFIYGDHTPYVINAGPYARAFFAYDERGFEFVPLMMLTPDNRIYREKRRVAGYLDFAPTVLEAAGGTFDIRTNGINLLKTPIADDTINFKEATYSRELLFKLAEKIPKYHAN